MRIEAKMQFSLAGKKPAVQTEQAFENVKKSIHFPATTVPVSERR
jgi:hypothetical protein